MAELALTPINQLGAAVARPVVDGFLQLALLRVNIGRLAVIDLVQAIEVNPTTTVLDRIVAGVLWTLVERSQPVGGATASDGRNVKLTAETHSPWTYRDGRPVARRLVFRGPVELAWGVTLDISEVPAAVTFFAGGFVGFDAPQEWEKRPDLLLAGP